jgi:hypothetical protein
MTQQKEDEMKLHPKRAVALTGALAVAAGLTLAGGGVAFAAAPYNPDANSVGSITFTDANGVPVTSGSINSPFAAFAVGSKLVTAGDTDGTLGVYLPVFGQPTASWSGDLVGLDTPFNPAPSSWPADLKGLVTALKPVVNQPSTDETLGTFAAGAPNTATTGPNTAQPTYQNLYEVRLFTGSNNAQYDSADVRISGTTWTLVPNPDQTINTTTTISATPASPSTNPTPTLTTTVTPAAAIPAAYVGGIGTVVVKDGATVIDTKIIAPGSASPYVVTTTSPTLSNPSDHSFTATFVPFNGTALNGSPSNSLPFHEGAPTPASTTTLTASWQAAAGGSAPTTFTGTVTGDGTTPLTAGKINLVDNGGSTPLNSAPIAVAADGSYSFDYLFTTSGAHSVVATFTDAGVYLPSSSAPQTHNLGNPGGTLCTASGGPVTDTAGKCDDKQFIQGTVPVGTLVVSTPYYDSVHSLNVGTLALDPTGTILTTTAQFGGAGLDPTNANADIIVTDTRAGNLNWTLQAQSSDLLDATTPTPDVINSQNVGLTALHSDPAAGFGSAPGSSLVGSDNPAANGVAPTASGSAGLGGAIHHNVAQATHGRGTVGIWGTLTLNAPTSTPAGVYTGTVTFTIVGSLVPSA